MQMTWSESSLPQNTIHNFLQKGHLLHTYIAIDILNFSPTFSIKIVWTYDNYFCQPLIQVGQWFDQIPDLENLIEHAVQWLRFCTWHFVELGTMVLNAYSLLSDDKTMGNLVANPVSANAYWGQMVRCWRWMNLLSRITICFNMGVSQELI